MLQIGTTAPSFTLPDASMEMVELSSFRGKKNVVLYFYPKDGTPVCTREAIDFSDHEDEFAQRKTVVFGVSRDDCLVHEEFRDKHGISLSLLSDTECEVSRLYDVLREQASADGASIRQGVQRCTFIIDKKGVLRHILQEANPREHVREVLKLVRQLDTH
jgi:thioredoxin-dependent peroxiredoxin